MREVFYIPKASILKLTRLYRRIPSPSYYFFNVVMIIADDEKTDIIFISFAPKIGAIISHHIRPRTRRVRGSDVGSISTIRHTFRCHWPLFLLRWTL